MTKRTDNKGRILRTGENQRKDGRYQYQFTDDSKHRHCIYALSLKELREKEENLKLEISHGLSIDSAKITLNDWFYQWISVYKKGKIKTVTYNHYLDKWNAYIKEELGNMPLFKVKQIHIIDFYTRLSTSYNLSKGTIKIVHNILRQALEQAVDNDIILKNPCKNAMKDLQAKDSHYKDALTMKEQQIFFKFLEENEVYSLYKPLFMLLFGSGLRIGEALALTWDDIDLHNNTLTVTKTIHYTKINNKYQHVVTSPKTRTSVRKIPLINDIKIELLKERQRQMSLGTRCKTMYRYDINNEVKQCIFDFVFTTKTCTPYDTHNINKVIKSIVNTYNAHEKEQALTEHRSQTLLRTFSCHYTRHSFATRCFENEIQVKTVADILGHSKTDITQDIYTHVTEKQKEKELQKLNINIV